MSDDSNDNDTEYSEDDEEEVDPEEESASEISEQDKVKEKKAVEKKEQGVKIRNEHYAYYPRELNPGLKHAGEVFRINIVNKNEDELPDGNAIKTFLKVVNPTMSFKLEEWERIDKQIKKSRTPIKEYMAMAIMQFVRDQELLERIRKQSLIDLGREEVRIQMEAEIEKKLMVKKAIWEPRFGKKSKNKTPSEIIESIDKTIGLEKDSDVETQEEKDKLVERLKKKSLWQPRYSKKPPAITTKPNDAEDAALEEEVDRMNNPDDTFLESIKTEGVMPEEKGVAVAQDAGTDDAPTQEEMTS
jgi:hypothetical protein